MGKETELESQLRSNPQLYSDYTQHTLNTYNENKHKQLKLWLICKLLYKYQTWSTIISSLK